MKRRGVFGVMMLALCYLLLQNCGNPEVVILEEEDWVLPDLGIDVPSKLSEYDLFESPISNMIPKKGVEPYALNSGLFTDYAFKKRFLYLPEGTTMEYHDSEVFAFPEGALIFKFFYYPNDFSDPNGSATLVETRVLYYKNGDWIALPYVWDDEQLDAYLDISGTNKDISWIDETGKTQELNYSVPNMVQCKSCHELNQKMVPIGPSARQLNGLFAYEAGEKNQLVHLQEIGWLANKPPLEDCPQLADWEQESFSLAERARAYLEINCGHCHRPEGPAKNSALNLMASEENPAAYGVGKTPIAAGRGSGGLKFDIYPGKPEASILVYRMQSEEPGVMMPELGRKRSHPEGVQLISDWVLSLGTEQKSE